MDKLYTPERRRKGKQNKKYMEWSVRNEEWTERVKMITATNKQNKLHGP
jgi:hypothetical protein